MIEKFCLKYCYCSILNMTSYKCYLDIVVSQINFFINIRRYLLLNFSIFDPKIIFFLVLYSFFLTFYIKNLITFFLNWIALHLRFKFLSWFQDLCYPFRNSLKYQRRSFGWMIARTLLKRFFPLPGLHKLFSMELLHEFIVRRADKTTRHSAFLCKLSYFQIFDIYSSFFFQ